MTARGRLRCPLVRAQRAEVEGPQRLKDVRLIVLDPIAVAVKGDSLSRLFRCHRV
jgi:hypothetical protein